MSNKLSSIIKSSILSVAILLTGGAWAAASLEETGATVPTTATLAFKGATLSQVTADTLSGVIGGSWAGAIAGNAMTFNNFDRTSEASGTITCQAQIQHGENVKGVLLTFTQDGSNVKVTKTGAKYISGTVGQSIAGGTNGYYDVSKLKLTLGKPTPIAVFDGASGGFKKTSINGVTFDKNGNTVPDDGSYVKISAAVGALFKLSQGYKYVVGEFTVTNLNESAAADRVLALWSPAEDGTHAYTPGVALANGGVITRGVWNKTIWSNTGFNGELATGISTAASRTFALTTEDSTGGNNTGTHLFELTGANPGTAVYGGTGEMGLRGAQTYRTFVIGGPATGSLSAMTDLVITKVVIYASNSRQFTSTDPTTIADVENPAAFYVGNGETINASTINAGVTASGAAYVYTEAGATLNLNAELPVRRVTFVGSISGVPGSADVLTLGSANDKVTLTNASYVPFIKGCGTVVYPDNTIPSSDSTGWLTSSDWAGTLSLNNIQGANNTQPGWYAPFHNYGSTNSTIKVSGFTGFFGADNYESPATLEIAAGSTFTLNNGNNGNSMTFAKLKGSGNIVICGNNGPAIQYVMRDASEFAGSITVSQSGSLYFKKSIVLGGGSSYNYNVDNYQKQICVLGDVTVAAGKTWTADSGIVVNGTLTKADSTATLSGTITGSGKIIYNDELPNSANFTANTWTGTVEVNGGATTAAGIVAADAAQFMNSSAKFTVASGTVTLGTIAGLTGKVNVKSGATLQIVDGTTTTKYLTLAETSGNLNLAGCTALATLTLDLGRNRDSSIVYPSSLKTLQLILDENLADDTELTFNVGNGTTLEAATVTVYKPDGSTVNNTAAAAVSADGHTVTVTYTPTVDGSAAWCAYEFETSDSTALKNTGSTTDSLNPDDVFSAATSVDGNGKLYTYSHPYRSISYPSDGNWSAMVRCTVPKLAEALVVAFGTNSGGIIGLAAGANPDTEMRVVQTTGNSHYVTNGVMPVLNGTTAQHVYVFTVASNQTVKVYCDNTLINTVVFPSRFSIGGGLQIGSIFAGIGSSGLKRCWYNDTDYNKLSEADQQAARIDSMRLYQTTLGANAIAQLSEEFPAVMLFEATISGGNDNEWASLGWTGGDITTINAYSKAIITVEDDATLTLPASITADELVFNIASGKMLTLVDADGGTTLNIGHPIEIDTGSVAFDTSSKTLDFAISGTGYVFVDTDKTISVAPGGSLSRVSGSGTVTYASYGSLPSALAFGDWTGTVVLPSFVAEGVNFNNYGQTGSTIALTGITSGWVNPDYTSVAATLRLDGAVNITAMSTRPYTFAEIDGTGNLSFATAGDQPTSVTIGEIAPTYSGTVTNNTTTTLNITTIALAGGASVVGGTKLLKVGGTGSLSVGSVTVGGVTQSGLQLAYANDGVYVARASYDGNGYTSVAAAIDAAVAASGDVSTITILDGSTTLPAGYEQYYIANGTVCKYQAMVVDSYGLIESEWFATAQGAIDSIAGKVPAERYYAIIYADTIASTSLATLYAQCEGGAELTLNSTVPEYQYTKSDSPVSGTIYAYTRGDKAAAFTWNTANASGSWNGAGNWRVGGNATTRWPRIAGDAVSFASDATVTLGKQYSVGSINVGSAVVFNASDAIVGEGLTVTLSASSFVLTASDASIALNSVTLSQDPTSGVDLMYVKATTPEGTTTYSLQAAGEMDGTTAVITNTTETVTIPASATAVAAQPTTSAFVIVATAAQFSTPNFLTITAKYGASGTQDITSAFVSQVIGGDASAAQIRMTLTGSQTVTVGGNDISVSPQVAASSPMTLDDTVGGDTEASFTIKTIPGLYYAVQTGAFNGSGVWVPDEYGDAVQATSASTSVTAPEFEGTVQYYKIAVGLSAADVSPTP